MDEIRLCGVRCRVRIGVTRTERSRPQEVLVDLALRTDAAPAAARDDLRLAVDYQSLEQLVRETAEAGERALIETLAERLAEAVLRREPRVQGVRVAVHKKPAAMKQVREVIVEIDRSRFVSG